MRANKLYVSSNGFKWFVYWNPLECKNKCKILYVDFVILHKDLIWLFALIIFKRISYKSSIKQHLKYGDWGAIRIFVKK